MLFKDRVKETTTTTGTGNITTAGAVTGFITFNTAFGTGSSNVFQYVIDSSTGSEWEVGIGYMSASTTLVRSRVLASSNSGSAVSFSAGTKNVRGTLAAAAVPINAVTQSDFSKTDNTFSNVTDLTVNLAAGRWYNVEFRGIISDTAVVSGVIDFNGGTATLTGGNGWVNVSSSEGFDTLVDAFHTLASTATGAGTGFSAEIAINLRIQVNAAGTFIPRFKQSSTNATATTLMKYALLTVTDITPN